MRTSTPARLSLITLLFLGCEGATAPPDSASTSASSSTRHTAPTASPVSPAEKPLSMEAMIRNAKAIDADPPSADEDAFYWGRWAIISPIAPPPRARGIGTSSTDPGIQQFNRAAIAAALRQALASAEPKVPDFLVMSAVDSATHFFGRANLKKLDDRSAPIVLTGVGAFLVLQPVIGREAGQNQSGLYLQRTNLSARFSDHRFVLQTQMPGGPSLRWPSQWGRLFEACFERPPLILESDNLRRGMWAWIDAHPTITLVSADGTQLWSGKLNVPGMREQ